MKITYNENSKIVEMLRNKICSNGGFCPCRREQVEDNRCMCKEFREQIADPDYEGYCHCMLYYKAK